MTLDEFTAQLDTHGSDLQSWPAPQRYQAEALLASSPEASKLWQTQSQTDLLLGDLPLPEFVGLADRVASQVLPDRSLPLSERLLNWLLPNGGMTELWRLATAACLPLLFGIVMGNYFNFGISPDSQVVDSWEDELAMISLTDYTENQVEL